MCRDEQVVPSSPLPVQRSPVPLESSDAESPDRLNSAQAASMSFIDTSSDTSTISPGNPPSPGACPVHDLNFQR